MEPSPDHRLLRLENQVRLLIRVALSLVLLLAVAFAAFTWQPQERSPAATRLKQVGRYQITGAGTGNFHRFVVIDTRTGLTKPMSPGNYWKAFDDIHAQKR